MPKKTPNIMRVSGWLPVSYSVYKAFERNIGEECYDMAKIVADDLDNNPKITNQKFIKLFALHLMIDESKLIKDLQYIAYVNFLIDFIRDSFIIYQETIKEEQEFAVAIASL
jgi:hypothetical protein